MSGKRKKILMQECKKALGRRAPLKAVWSRIRGEVIGIDQFRQFKKRFATIWPHHKSVCTSRLEKRNPKPRSGRRRLQMKDIFWSTFNKG